MACLALKGNILYCKDPQKIIAMSDSYLIFDKKRILGAFRDLPIRYADIPVINCGNRLIIPGFTDLHLHASHFPVRGIGTGLPAEERLSQILFDEESRYYDIWYAEKAYRLFTSALAAGATTRACVFATIHTTSTMFLMDRLEETGLRTMVGKVVMDTNCPDSICENNPENALADTREWISKCLGRFQNTSMILTPYQQEYCSDELLDGLGKLQRETCLPLQSHFSHTTPELTWHDNGRHSRSRYLNNGLLGGPHCRVVVSHGIRSDDRELTLLKKHGVFVAYCPESDLAAGFGTSPVKKLIHMGVSCGLGTDIGSGATMSMFRAISEAIRSSRQYHSIFDQTVPPLSFSEAFYMATKGGGAFFGRVGSFETDYEFDAVVIDDDNLGNVRHFSLINRLERAVHLCDDRNVVLKYVAGNKIKDTMTS